MEAPRADRHLIRGVGLRRRWMSPRRRGSVVGGMHSASVDEVASLAAYFLRSQRRGAEARRERNQEATPARCQRDSCAPWTRQRRDRFATSARHARAWKATPSPVRTDPTIGGVADRRFKERRLGAAQPSKRNPTLQGVLLAINSAPSRCHSSNPPPPGGGVSRRLTEGADGSQLSSCFLPLRRAPRAPPAGEDWKGRRPPRY
jgi:hypothetical protein